MILKSIQILCFLIVLVKFYECHQGQHAQNQQQHHDPMSSNINTDHVLEHLDGVINKPKEQMSKEEQNFYYFKLHDYDNNNMLDGLELVSAFAHSEEHKDEHQQANETDSHHQQQQQQHQRISDEELIKLIDEILKDEDKNNDGFITYPEFLAAISQ